MWSRIRQFINNSFFDSKKTPLQRYLLPLIFAGLIIIMKSILKSDLGNRLSFHLLMLAVVFSAWFGGLGPGLLATTVIGFLNDALFHNPAVTFLSRDRLVTTIIFAIEGILISIIAEAKIQADKQRDDFISITSHELKNPITALSGYLYVLQRETLNGSTKKMLSAIGKAKDEVHRITGLVNDLLDVSRLESGKFSYKDERITLETFLKDLVTEQQMISTTHKMIVKGKSSHFMEADRQRLTQVFTNLLANAIKYSPKADKVRVEIEDRRRSTCIRIRDYGVGIPSAALDKIFDRFYRAGNAGSAQGLGLGLFISSQIVHHYNGTLSVKSAQGRGSTFFVELPSKPLKVS